MLLLNLHSCERFFFCGNFRGKMFYNRIFLICQSNLTHSPIFLRDEWNLLRALLLLNFQPNNSGKKEQSNAVNVYMQHKLITVIRARNGNVCLFGLFSGAMQSMRFPKGFSKIRVIWPNMVLPGLWTVFLYLGGRGFTEKLVVVVSSFRRPSRRPRVQIHLN